MNTTYIATDIGKKDNANGICALLSVNGQLQVAKILKQITDQVPEGIWCMPPRSLHITLCEIMQAKTYHEDKEVLFQKHFNQYQRALNTALKDVRPIEILFDRVEVSPNAIIIRGNNDTALATIRSKLVESLPLPAETKQPPTIVHSSIARFTQGLDMAKLESVISKLDISFTETITEFQLIHNGSPHMLNYEIASHHPLARVADK